MIGIDDPTAATVQPTPEAAGTAGFFTEGSPGVTAATKVRASWLNAVQNELLSFLTAVSITPVKTTYNQVLTAVQMLIQRSSPSSAVAAGTSDAITASFTPAITALTSGMPLRVRASAANTTTTPTLAVNGLAAKTIVKGANAALSAGDIAGAGAWFTVIYDSTLDKFVLSNPATGVASVARAWTDVTASRALGTTYTNNKSYDIHVNVYTGATAASQYVQATVGGVVVARQQGDTTNGYSASSIYFVVPPGATYSVSGTRTLGASTYGPSIWAEMS